jgi:hypothetical protein
MGNAARRLRDLLILLAWVLLFYLAFDAWLTAHRAHNDLTELAALIWVVSLTLGAIAAVVLYFRNVRWNRRFEGGQCPACGYDVRATPDRCPECGFEFSPSHTSLPAWLNATALDYARTRPNRPDK